MAAPAAAGADFDLGPDRDLLGRPDQLAALRASDDGHRQQHPGDGAPLKHARGDPDRASHAHADADADAHHVEKVGVSDRHAKPGQRTDGVAVLDRGSVAFGLRLGDTLAGPPTGR
jgi:hypothetical protein